MILDGYGCGKGSERSWGGWIRPKYLVQKFRGIDKEHLKREKSNKCSRIVKAQTHKKKSHRPAQKIQKNMSKRLYGWQI